MESLYWILFAIPSIVIASTIHEYAHAWTAYQLGDATAKAEGRMSLNPLVHIDPLGALFMILFRFGWSKPVPVNEYNFDNPPVGTGLTAISGPISNLLLAVITAILYNLFSPLPIWLQLFTTTFIVVNISLMIFNLLPLPPLDGHKIIRAILPPSLRYYWEMLERYSLIILLFIFLPFSPLSTLTTYLISQTLEFFLNLLLRV
jgi:Zn-dependent protease